MHTLLLLALLAVHPGTLTRAVFDVRSCGTFEVRTCHVRTGDVLRADVLRADARRATAQAGRLREESVQSAALGRAMKYRVLVPEGYEDTLERYPVLYLLHGLTGDYTDWTTRTNIAAYTRTVPLIIVMPDGGNQWYTNAADGTAKFEDYVATDLPADVVLKYRTLNSRYGRAIAGLSMGGYGALKLALKRPAQYAVAGGFSGAFTITRDLGARLNPTEQGRVKTIFGEADSPTRKDNDVYALAATLKPATTPYLYVDCGTNDGLLDSNRELVQAMRTAGLAYEYHEVAGAHTWDYWDRRIREFLPILMRKLAN
ncbi:MAG TPA: alpha/beta hydrolase family protein [Vicinamibacterales bacterium]|nr:alpha/beta hydrolase family protein [Vicinamibacterales bacterium]